MHASILIRDQQIFAETFDDIPKFELHVGLCILKRRKQETLYVDNRLALGVVYFMYFLYNGGYLHLNLLFQKDFQGYFLLELGY